MQIARFARQLRVVIENVARNLLRVIARANSQAGRGRRSIEPYLVLLSRVEELAVEAHCQNFRVFPSRYFSNKLAKIPFVRENDWRLGTKETKTKLDRQVRKEEQRCDSRWIMQRAYILGLRRVFGLSTLWIGLRKFFILHLFHPPFLHKIRDKRRQARVNEIFYESPLIVRSSWPKTVAENLLN